jgi:hypothetical protein
MHVDTRPAWPESADLFFLFEKLFTNGREIAAPTTINIYFILKRKNDVKQFVKENKKNISYNIRLKIHK